MKKTIPVLCVALLAAAVTLPGLDLLVGPRFSLGHTFDYGGDYRDYLDADDARRRFAVKFSLGAFTEIRFSPLLALQPELLFTEGGHCDYSDWTVDSRSTKKYLEALLLAKLIVPTGRNNLQLFAGPDLRYGIGTWEYDIDDVTVAEYDREGRKAADIRNTYLGVVAGAGLRLPRGCNSLQLDARCYFSLLNVDATDAIARKPAALWLNLGYGFCLAGGDSSARPSRIEKGFHQDTLVARSEDIPNNPSFSAYLDSEYIQQQLHTHAVMMDALMGLEAAARFMPFDMEAFILAPVEILAGLRHPAAGVWLHRFRINRQGTTRTYNLWFVARKRQKPLCIPGIMGTTLAGLNLQDNLEKDVHAAASARVKNPANRAARPFIVDSRVLPGANAGEDAWREEWTVQVGSETVTVSIDFSLGPFEILNYTLIWE